MADNYLRVGASIAGEIVEADVVNVDTPDVNSVPVKPRKTIKEFMDSFKDNILEMFKEEGDTKF
jgi:hypothetical protein